MPLSALQAATSAAYAQLQQQQVRQAADQAEAKARGLRKQAQQAESEAVRAQQNAESLRSQSQQANGAANLARQAVSSTESLGRLQTQIRKVLATDDWSALPAAPAAPVVNTQGQVTGTTVNVTA